MVTIMHFIYLLLNYSGVFPGSLTERGSSCCLNFSLEDLRVIFFQHFRYREGLGAAVRSSCIPYPKGDAMGKREGMRGALF